MSPRVFFLVASLAIALVACAEPSSGSEAAKPVAENAAQAAVSEPPAPEWPSSTECVQGELRLFACSLTNGQKVALCSSPKASEDSGYLRYALGSGERADVVFPSERSAPGESFLRTPVHFFNGNSRHAYSIDTGADRYVLYQLGSARDGRLARGGLMVLSNDGSLARHDACTSLDEAEQDALDLPPFDMKPDPLLGELSTLPFGAKE